MGTGSFIPSINVNSCIIEEQENHLVIAIRVPKATIAGNIPCSRQWPKYLERMIKEFGAPEPTYH